MTQYTTNATSRDPTTTTETNPRQTDSPEDLARNLFQTPTSTGLSATPKLFRALQHHSNQQGNVGATYTGPLDFLDNQATFNLLWPNPTPVFVHPPNSGGITDITIKLRSFFELCQLQIFNSVFRLDYVGSTENLDAHTIEAIGTNLRHLSMVYTVKGETKSASPDAIYQRYLEELPMLPEDAETWGFNLVNLFWMSLTEQL